MNKSTKKWILQRVSAILIIPIMIWFILNFVFIYDKTYLEVFNFFNNNLNKFLMSVFLILSFFHLILGLSEVFEDYIEKEKIKNVANKITKFLGIIIPIITIVVLFNLKL